MRIAILLEYYKHNKKLFHNIFGYIKYCSFILLFSLTYGLYCSIGYDNFVVPFFAMLLIGLASSYIADFILLIIKGTKNKKKKK